MNRPKAKTNEILGHYKPCVFSKDGTNPFRYSDKCRDCSSSTLCENYIPSRHTQSKVVQACENEMLRGSNPLPIQRLFNMPYDNHKGFELIRRLNDGGAI